MNPRPRIDTTTAEPASSSMPTLPPLSPATPPSDKQGRSLLLPAAFVASLVVHAAVLAWTIWSWEPREGMEVAVEPVLVAVLFDTPALEAEQPLIGEADDAEDALPEPLLPESAAETPPQELETSEAPEPVPAPEIPPIREEAATLTPAQSPELSVVLPEPDAPIPAPRPTERAQQPSPQRQAARPVSPPARQRPTGRTPQRDTPTPNRPVAAGRSGGATAGAEASFARRLLAHVERHKRYPPEAARRGITGAARLSITIDRSGRLSGARITARSGHAVLDEAALAVARRAAPYPRPPEGVGGATISFAVTLRFSR